MNLVTVTHPIHGEQQATVPDQDAKLCMACLQPKNDGFFYISEDELIDLVHRDEGIKDCFFRGLQVTLNEASTDCFDETASRQHWKFNDTFVDFQGWTEAGFKHRYKRSPVNLGLPELQKEHPLTRAP